MIFYFDFIILNMAFYPLETFSFPGTVSNNIAKLRYFVENSNLLAVCGRPRGLGKVDTLLKAEQLVFTHWSLEFSSKFPAYGFSESQQAVYGHPDEVPMFEDTMTTVNIDLLLHIANFFKYHITRKEEATLFHQFEQLAEDQKPRVWRHRIEQVWRKLGRSWKGSYGKWLQQIILETEVPYLFTDLDYQHIFMIRIRSRKFDRPSLAATSLPIQSIIKMGFKR